MLWSFSFVVQERCEPFQMYLQLAVSFLSRFHQVLVVQLLLYHLLTHKWIDIHVKWQFDLDAKLPDRRSCCTSIASCPTMQRNLFLRADQRAYSNCEFSWKILVSCSLKPGYCCQLAYFTAATDMLLLLVKDFLQLKSAAAARRRCDACTHRLHDLSCVCTHPNLSSING